MTLESEPRGARRRLEAGWVAKSDWGSRPPLSAMMGAVHGRTVGLENPRGALAQRFESVAHRQGR